MYGLAAPDAQMHTVAAMGKCAHGRRGRRGKAADLRIFNVELNVRGDIGGLDRGQVGPEDLGRGELEAHFDSPLQARGESSFLAPIRTPRVPGQGQGKASQLRQSRPQR